MTHCDIRPPSRLIIRRKITKEKQEDTSLLPSDHKNEPKTFRLPKMSFYIRQSFIGGDPGFDLKSYMFIDDKNITIKAMLETSLD